jgi:hypothetical protein
VAFSNAPEFFKPIFSCDISGRLSMRTTLIVQTVHFSPDGRAKCLSSLLHLPSPEDGNF